MQSAFVFIIGTNLMLGEDTSVRACKLGRRPTDRPNLGPETFSIFRGVFWFLVDVIDITASLSIKFEAWLKWRRATCKGEGESENESESQMLLFFSFPFSFLPL